MISTSEIKSIQYKKLNLILADNLTNYFFSPEPIYQNIIKSLRFCSQHTILEENQNKELSRFTSSLYCRNKYCFICNNIKSVVYTNRFNNLLEDTNENHYFADKYFYFITLTLKHGHEVRNYIYLKDLESYKSKLFRRKTWKTHFGTINSKNKNSFISSNEITYTDNGYNIHSHIFAITTPIKLAVKDLQIELQNEWFKITGDSWNVRLDLIKNTTDKSFTKTLQEVFKYNVKINLQNITNKEIIYKLGEWINESHGRKLIKTYGYLRKFNLFSRQSNYDNISSQKFIDYNNQYYLTKTSKLKLNQNIKITQKIDKKSLDISNIKILKNTNTQINITNEIDNYIEKIKTKDYHSHLKNDTLITMEKSTKTQEEIEKENEILTYTINKYISNIKIDLSINPF